MNRNIYEQISFYMVIFALALFLYVYAWDIHSGPEEKWVHYNANSPNTIINEHSSFESCNKAMDQSQAQSGCRRTDGPYSLINAIAEFLF